MEATQRKTSALALVARALVSTADFEQALGTLIETVGRLLDVESGGFLLYEPERDELVLQRPAFGIDNPGLISEYHVPLSAGGNAVRVFLSQQPYVTNDAPHDSRFIQRYVKMFGGQRILSIPLSVEDRPIGVFHAINKRSGDFVQADVDLLLEMAPLIAAGVQSARMFRELQEQRRQFERAVFLQAQLSRAVLEAPGMASLAERLADLIDRPVVVLDEALRPLASARWPDDQVPSQAWLSQSREPSGAGRRTPRPVLTPIGVGGHFGGYVAVLPEGSPLGIVDLRAIEHAAGVFALEMLREQSAYEVESRLKSDLLQDLFTGTYQDEEEAADLLSRLGYTVAGPFRVVRVEPVIRPAALRPGDARWQAEIQGPGSRLYAGFSEVCAKVAGVAAVAPWRSGFLLLLPASSPDTDMVLARELLAALRSAAQSVRPGLQVHVALGSVAASARGVAKSLEQAEQALTVGRTLGVTERPIVFEHLGVYRVLLGPNVARDRHDFVEEALGAVVRYDAEQNTGLLDTLRAWVAADYNVHEAADTMHLHTNTLRYRLKRLGSLLGGDPSRGDLRFQVELALKLLDLPRLAGQVPDE
jgi:hypothetical protein